MCGFHTFWTNTAKQALSNIIILHFTKTVPGKEHLVQLMTNSEKRYYSGSSWKMSNIYSWRILQILHLEYKSNIIKDKHKWLVNIWVWINHKCGY